MTLADKKWLWGSCRWIPQFLALEDRSYSNRAAYGRYRMGVYLRQNIARPRKTKEREGALLDTREREMTKELHPIGRTAVCEIAKFITALFSLG